MPLQECPDCGHNVSTRAVACPQCGAPNDGGNASASPSSPTEPGPASTQVTPTSDAPSTSDLGSYDRITGRLNFISLALGLLAMFAYQIWILPVGAVMVGGAALMRNDPGGLTGKWRAWVGLVLGVLYSLLMITTYAGY